VGLIHITVIRCTDMRDQYSTKNVASHILATSGYSTAVGTPIGESDITIARNILRSVINTARPVPPSPSVASAKDIVADIPPIPLATRSSVGTQTDAATPPTSLEGLIRAAGFSLANFATELRVLERRLESQHNEVLNEFKRIERNKQ
jgi:hypothetical protein